MKNGKIFAALLTLILSVLMILSCGGILSGGGDDTSVIPEEVLNLAGGVFDLIGSVFESDYSDPTDDPTYPAGMTVSWITEPTVLNLAFSGFTPPDDPGGPVVNGSITLAQTGSSPITMSLSGTLSITNYTYSSVSLSATAV